MVSKPLFASPADALRALFNGWPTDRGDGTGFAEAYIMAIDGYQLDAIEMAVRRLIRGEFDDVDKRFLPTPAQLSNAVAYCAKVLEPVVARQALPAPGSETLTEEEIARRQALADRARDRFGIKRQQGETVTDRDAVPAAKLAELDRAVAAVAERIKVDGLPKLSDEAKALFREQAERAVPTPAEQFDE